MKALLEALHSVYATGEFSVIDKVTTEQYVQLGKFFPEGRAALKSEIHLWRTVFSDLRVDAIETLEQGDRIAVRGLISGMHTGSQFGFPVLGLAPTGRPVRIPFHAMYRLQNGRIAERQQVVDWMSLVQQIHFPVTAPVPVEPRPFEILATFPTGLFLEAVAFDGDGTAYITSLLHGDVIRRTPSGAIDTLVHIDLGLGDLLMCLVFDTEHSFYVGVQSTTAELAGVWHFDTKGKGRRVAPLPPHAEPNGIAMDEAGCVYVADSALGTIWRLQPGASHVDAWFVDPLLSRRPVVGFVPGANGLQIWRQEIIVTNSDAATLLRVPIGSDGRPGTPMLHATDMGGDDMAIDEEGTIYCTTHPANKVVAIRRDGRKSVVGGVEQGIIGPTAAAFGVGAADQDWVYVVTDGGLFAPVPGMPIQPALVRLHVGVRGEPCYWMRKPAR